MLQRSGICRIVPFARHTVCAECFASEAVSLEHADPHAQNALRTHGVLTNEHASDTLEYLVLQPETEQSDQPSNLFGGRCVKRS
jgi:hypothetical protein